MDGFQSDPVFLPTKEEIAEIEKRKTSLSFDGCWVRDGGTRSFDRDRAICAAQTPGKEIHRFDAVRVSSAHRVRPILDMNQTNDSAIEKTDEKRIRFGGLTWQFVAPGYYCAEEAIGEFRFDLLDGDYGRSSVRRSLLSWFYSRCAEETWQDGEKPSDDELAMEKQ